jgi:type II secretory pathway pseudopilin PulG
MKHTLIASLLAVATALPAAAFSQTGLSRAQVRAELVELQQAGYRGTTSDATYPSELQAAEQRIAARNASQANDAANSGSGPATSGSSASGGRAAPAQEIPGFHSIYFGS